MTDAIRHRGPDDSGFYRDSWAALGHRRLSIIDVAGGRQPMENEAGNLSIFYNGEIYNHADLRPELERAGHVYETRCDTETILHAYEQFGPDCLSRFRGMFSFAIWDRESRTLFCARDRLGIKPLYYYFDGRVFAFASEVKALLEHPAISPRLNEAVLPEYLAFGYISGENSLFSGIRKLLPGHFLTISVDRFRPEIRQYWHLPEQQAPEQQAPEQRSDAEWISECRSRLEESVRLRLMSDVPLGMFLSGGVDSSAIAAIMQRMVREPIQTFAVGYREARFSELEFARAAAREIGADYHQVLVGKHDFFNALPRLIWQEDEPPAWPSSVSLYFVSKLAAERVKVVLTGEGSDELFGGYERYRYELINRRWLPPYRLLPSALRRLIRDRIASTSLLSGSLRRKLRHTVVGREDTLESLYIDSMYSAFSAQEQAALFRGLRAPSAYDSFMLDWNAAPQLPYLDRLLYTDKKHYLVKLLTKQDTMSMAASIESRVPFLDHPLVEFAAQVPGRLKIRGQVQKFILKEAIKDLLPASLVHRKKMGFPTPFKSWILEPSSAPLYDLLQSKDKLLSAYIDPAALRSLLDRHRGGLDDNTDKIWNLLNLQLWGDLFITGKRDRWWDGVFTEENLPAAV